MCSPHANILRLPRPGDKDESHPLTSYFISSSHNTYLVGHQLYGDSTTAGYKYVLRRACRCIEIDVWDGDNGEPEVFHGWTLTKEIGFREVCKAIRDNAFWTECGEEVMGPVVISLECHCSAKQQEKMVKIMKDVWRGILVEKPIDGKGTLHEVDCVPTLKELKGKILVKTKYHPPEQQEEAKALRESVAQMTITPKRASTNPENKSSSSEDSSTDEELLEFARFSGKPKPKKQKITRALSDLAIYIGATHFPGTFTPPTPFRAGTVFSFSEKVFANHQHAYPQQLFNHNLNHFMRVYPFGLRFSSSNADPTQFWRRGVQIVALNWQKVDEGMMLNEGMFAGEGGYVLKPPHFRPGADGGPPPPAPERKRLDLEIEVLAAQNIPLPDDDENPERFEPYVKVEVYVDDPALNADEIKGRTRKAKNKGTDALWEPKKKTKKIGEVVKFKGVEGVRDPAMCFVRIKVHDEEFGKDDLAGWGCMRLDRTRRGWRVVRLIDRKGRRSEGVLLVRVGWRMVA
ncbi:PLC-like phosphodiesterase [Terfezia boudieri ATCC MYA-4762]|uniref:Phosphoinositide phospholipase C n=1 Tax=Terfezia boudieri ATCC MYA-4762 TaxID=1051890 RepID=A0A3N4LFB1_9PEZI|nr:PLC-like phosphodiesterase [Terfezia boudieri ATCC MYA-4762]